MSGQKIVSFSDVFHMGRSESIKQNKTDKGFKSIFDDSVGMSGNNDNSTKSKYNKTAYAKDNNSINSIKEKNQPQATGNKKQTANTVSVEENNVTTENNILEKVNVEDMDKLAVEITKEVAKLLDITEEQLETILSSMGIGIMDLFNTDYMKQLLLQVNNTDDPLIFITDVDMQEQLTNLKNTMKNILNNPETFISERIMADILKEPEQDMLYEPNTEDITKDLLNNPVDTINKPDVEKLQEKPIDIIQKPITDEPAKQTAVESDDITVVPENQNTDDIIEDVTKDLTAKEPEEVYMELESKEDHLIQGLEADDVNVISNNSNNKPVVNQVADEAKNQVPTKDNSNVGEVKVKTDSLNQEIPIKVIKENNNTELDSNGQSKDNLSKENNLSVNDFMNQLIKNIKGSDEQSANQTKVFKEIVNQVIEQVKIIVKPGTSSMEIQLNPESLGRINLQVIAKDTGLVAQFVAQNQIAKEAIESQIITLKENLNNQGLKVESIEVMVSSHGFEKNNDSADDKQQGKQTKKKLSTEEINALMADEVTAEEQLAADIMMQNGSSIEYIA